LSYLTSTAPQKKRPSRSSVGVRPCFRGHRHCAAATSVRGSGRKNGSAGGRTKECQGPEENMT
jgi:hypothetical protein